MIIIIVFIAAFPLLTSIIKNYLGYDNFKVKSNKIQLFSLSLQRISKICIVSFIVFSTYFSHIPNFGMAIYERKNRI